MDKQTQTTLFSSAKDDWETPAWLFGLLDAEFNFTLDAAANPANTKCARYWTQEDDGLAQPWEGQVWCNPPYSRGVGVWIAKAAAEAAKGATVVLLLPARTDTRWFHDHVLGTAEVRLVKGRLKFGGAESAAPFPSMVCIWHPRRQFGHVLGRTIDSKQQDYL